MPMAHIYVNPMEVNDLYTSRGAREGDKETGMLVEVDIDKFHIDYKKEYPDLNTFPPDDPDYFVTTWIRLVKK
ncbi:MAG: hypothetical protein KBC35_04015 [Candidatus Pacebacteria bacterium]|jgi:hypothetical protein|nr:hypothetical protein [Candidatus Paceibacterota bacterium]